MRVDSCTLLAAAFSPWRDLNPAASRVNGQLVVTSSPFDVVVGLGTIVVGTADNVLRPLLVGKDTEMPDLMVMLSTFGGLALFGAIGLVIGPVIAALFLTMWRIYSDTFADVLSTPGVSPHGS